MKTQSVEDAIAVAVTGALKAVPDVDAPGVFHLAAPPPREQAVLSLWHAMMVAAAVSAGEQRKRGHAHVASDDGDDGAIYGSDSEASVRPSTALENKKKPSYVARKEEKTLLEQEVRDLEAHADQLRQTCGIAGVAAASAQLRATVEQHQLLIASAQSILSDFTHNLQRSPIECFIHLTRDWRQRQATLLALRGPKTELARRFLAARTRFIQPTRTCTEASKFHLQDGGFSTVKLTVTPFHGLRSARQVYDALMFYLLNIEMQISELTGSTTVNENDRDFTTDYLSSGDSGNGATMGVLCHRLATNLGDELVVEKNSIQFISFHHPEESSSLDGLKGDEFALLTSDYANVDELYPYAPDTRLRKDINTVLRISSHREMSSEGGEELVVVLTYWVYIKTHAAQLKDRVLTATQLERVHDRLVHAMDILPVSIQQSLYGATG